MHGIVKFFAAIEILISVAVLLFGMLAMAQSGLAAISIVGVGLGLLLSGALLYCVGQMVEELIAVRKSTEAQAAFFAERFGRKE